MRPIIGAHGTLRAVEDLRAGRHHDGGLVAGGELAQVRVTDRQGGDLRLEVAPQHVGPAHVLAQQRQHLLVQHAAPKQFQRRDAQAFLEDLGRVRRVTAGRHAAHVEMVAQRAHDRDALRPREDRPERQDVGDVLAPAIGIVGDHDVTLLPGVERQEVPHDREQSGASSS